MAAPAANATAALAAPAANATAALAAPAANATAASVAQNPVKQALQNVNSLV